MTRRSVTLFGISNCDTVKKARTWLADRDIDVSFHDLRKNGLTPEHLQQWMDGLDWQTLVNRRSSTWRQLDQASQSAADDAQGAAALLLAHPTLIKRPVVEWGFGQPVVTVGFVAADWQQRIDG